MRRKDELAVDKISECVKVEFMEKGFFGRFYTFKKPKKQTAQPEALQTICRPNTAVKELVDEPSTRLFEYFMSAENSLFLKR